MAVELLKKENNIVELKVTVDVKDYEDAMQKAYVKNVKKFNIAGFRKGKAPRKIIEQYYGEAVFYDDAANIFCPVYYDAAVEELQLEPVEMPDINIEKIGDGEPCVFVAKVTVKPEVKLGQYKGLQIEKPVYPVSEQSVDAEVEKIREQNARIIDVSDQNASTGDIVKIDFEGFVDDVAFDGGAGKDYELTLGSGTFIKGFEEQLVGKSCGEEISVDVRFPEDYHAENLKDKQAIFKVTINSIKRKELADIDDEFAKDVSEFDTLEQYKNDIREKLTQENEKRADKELKNNAVKAVVDNAEIDIPDVMIDNQINYMIKDFENSLSQQGASLQDYYNYTGLTPDAMRQNYKQPAAQQVKTSLVIEAIKKQENITVTDQVIEDEYKKMSEAYKVEIDKIKQFVSASNLRYDLEVNDTVQFIVDNSTVVEKVQEATQATTHPTDEPTDEPADESESQQVEG